jgi:hypothetical protein
MIEPKVILQHSLADRDKWRGIFQSEEFQHICALTLAQLSLHVSTQPQLEGARLFMGTLLDMIEPETKARHLEIKTLSYQSEETEGS